MKRKGLNLRKHLKSDVTCWICFNMLPSAHWQLALIYSNSGKLTKTLVKSLCLGGIFLCTVGFFSSFLQLINFICFLRLWLFNRRNYKKQHFFTEKEGIARYRELCWTQGLYSCFKICKTDSGVYFKSVYFLFFISYSCMINKSLTDHKIVLLFRLCCNWG